MLENILKILEPTIISILGIIISYLGAVAIKYIKTKKESIIAKMGQENYNHTLKIAENVYQFVDENFRLSGIVGKVTSEKIALFDAELLKRIPNLTQEQIDVLRQTIAGQINAGREVIVTPAISTVQTNPIETSTETPIVEGTPQQ